MTLAELLTEFEGLSFVSLVGNVASVATGTTGTLLSVAAFTGGDTVEVQYIFSASSS